MEIFNLLKSDFYILSKCNFLNLIVDDKNNDIKKINKNMSILFIDTTKLKIKIKTNDKFKLLLFLLSKLKKNVYHKKNDENYHLNIQIQKNFSLKKYFSDNEKCYELNFDNDQHKKFLYKNIFRKYVLLFLSPLIHNKINATINVPKNNIVDKIVVNKKNNYELKALIYKSGNEEYGHYICIKKINEKFYCYDDENINEIKNPIFNFVDNNKYVRILLYEKK